MDSKMSFTLLVIASVSLLRPLLIQQMQDQLDDAWSYMVLTSAALIVVAEVIASTTFTAIVSQYTIKSFGSKSWFVMMMAWIANMALDGIGQFLRIPAGQKIALLLVSEYTFLVIIVPMLLMATLPRFCKFLSVASIANVMLALLMATCDAATGQLRFQTSTDFAMVTITFLKFSMQMGWKDTFSYCQLVGKILSFPIVYKTMKSSNPIPKKNEQTSKWFIITAQFGRTFAYATFICLARARTTNASWWGSIWLPLNIVIPFVGIHLTTPFWLWYVGDRKKNTEFLIRTIFLATSFGFILLVVGFIPFFQGHCMAVAVTVLVSSDWLFDQLMTLVGLNDGEIALQKTFDSLLLPTMVVLLNLNKYIGKGLVADEAINTFHLILVITTGLSLCVIFFMQKSKID